MYQNNTEDFKEYYRLTWAESRIKKFVQKREEDPDLMPQILTALNVCERRLLNLGEILEM